MITAMTTGSSQSERYCRLLRRRITGMPHVELIQGYDAPVLSKISGSVCMNIDCFNLYLLILTPSLWGRIVGHEVSGRHVVNHDLERRNPILYKLEAGRYSPATRKGFILRAGDIGACAAVDRDH
jgi:hypothetical protein